MILCSFSQSCTQGQKWNKRPFRSWITAQLEVQQKSACTYKRLCVSSLSVIIETVRSILFFWKSLFCHFPDGFFHYFLNPCEHFKVRAVGEWNYNRRHHCEGNYRHSLLMAAEERSEPLSRSTKSTATEAEIALKRRRPTSSGGGDQLGFAACSVAFGRVSSDCNRVHGLSVQVSED